jgi:tetratricopeptide (TPR) repeat protein
MTSPIKPTSRPEASSVEATLLARLGLPAGASAQDVEAAHDGLIDFLESTPNDLRGWSRQQIGMIDEAFAILSDPTIDRSAMGGEAIVETAFEPAPVPAVKRESPMRPAATTGKRRTRRMAVGAAAIVGVIAIAIAGFNLNGGTGIPPLNGTPDPAAAASPAIDTVKVAELMQKIQADPNDTVSLQSLADIYYLASDFKTAGGFLEKVVTIEPKNVTARLALGAALFNLGDSAGAKEQWQQVLALEPNNLEAHYDLGFMYLSASPPDIANVRLEWNKVIAIDPNSDVAKTVATHLATLEASPAPGASGAPASAAPSAGPATSPAPSVK